MKKMLTLFLIVLAGTSGFAQREHFVFVNHQEKLPFYVRMGEQIFSSSLAGHLTIAPLSDSVYAMYVGFPRSRFPEQLFEVRVASSDKGLLLSNQGGSWQLVDLLTGDVIKPVNSSGLSGDVQLRRKQDSYSMLMADVVDDSSVLYTVDSTRAKSASPAVAAKGIEGGENQSGERRVESASPAGAAKGIEGGEVRAKSGVRGADVVRVETRVRKAATDTTVGNNDGRVAGGVDSAGKMDVAAVKEAPGKTTEKTSTEKDSIHNEMKTAGLDSGQGNVLVTDKLKTAGVDSGQNAVVTDKLKTGADSLVSLGEVKTDSALRGRPGTGDSAEQNRLAEQRRDKTRVRPEAKAVAEEGQAAANAAPKEGMDTTNAALKEAQDITNKDQKRPVTESGLKPAADSGSRKGRKSRRQRKETGSDSIGDGTAPAGDADRVIRLEEVESREGRVLLYLDRSGGLTDTIRLIIPRL